MLFNSIEFLFLFLPVCLAVFHSLRLYKPPAVVAWLVFCSLFFYAWWEPRYLILLLSSAAVNFLLGRTLGQATASSTRNTLLGIGLLWNLGLLGYYKYAAFLVSNVTAVFGVQLSEPNIILPLAISFFTFQQIAYLSDIHSGEPSEQSAMRYLLFVTFFPQLIAGPIVHHKEMLPQFARIQSRFSIDLVAPGITLIVLGLAKKVLLADSLAIFANPGFDLVSTGTALSASEAWLSISAYTLQIYFDFSGYCDIAIGTALLFGIRLPINFNSPYQSASIIDYWRRWHMTLSRFMRDYVYIPLGGNRRRQFRWLMNLLATTAVSGLWHGAAWTFVIWGCLHGAFLIVNHLWRKYSVRRAALNESVLWKGFCLLLTFMCVMLSWVYFRSADLHSAHLFLANLVATTAVTEPVFYNAVLNGVHGDVYASLLQAFGLWPLALTMVFSGLFIVFFLPNSLAIVGQQSLGFPALEKGIDRHWLPVYWRANVPWALTIAVSFWLVSISLTAVSPFLYFQF